jgi:hypothetical protein
MMNFTDLRFLLPDYPALFTDQLRLAVPAYLARFKGPSREHSQSDLRCHLAWRAERGLNPLAARRPIGTAACMNIRRRPRRQCPLVAADHVR